MNLLVSGAAVDRLGAELEACGPAIRLLRLERSGEVHVDRKRCPDHDCQPDVAWLSLDIFAESQLARFIDLVEQSPGIQWLHTVHAGLDLPFYSTLLGRRVRLSNSHVHAPAVAEFVMGHVLSVFQAHDRIRQLQREKRWQPLGFRELDQSRWLVVGVGHVGAEVARRASSFGAHVTGIRRRNVPHPAVEGVATFDQLHGCLGDADVVVLSSPLTRETRNLANADFMAAMKPGAVLVNVARGGLVDESALVAGLDRGRPGYAILDVTVVEPLPSTSPLWAHERVRLTAHSAFAGSGTEGRGDRQFLENLRRYCAGKPLLEEVTGI